MLNASPAALSPRFSRFSPSYAFPLAHRSLKSIWEFDCKEVSGERECLELADGRYKQVKSGRPRLASWAGKRASPQFMLQWKSVTSA